MNRVRLSAADAMLQAHTALRRDLRELHAVLRTQGDATPVYLRLERLQSHLAEHFRCEEQGGYLKEVRRREPHRARVIAELHDDHRRLAQTLGSILEEVRWSGSLSERERDRIRGWVAEVRRHEARENRLVQDAFNRDSGPED